MLTVLLEETNNADCAARETNNADCAARGD